MKVFTYILYVLTLVISLGQTVRARDVDHSAALNQVAEEGLSSVKVTTIDGRTRVCTGQNVTLILTVSGLVDGYTAVWRKVGTEGVLQATADPYLLEAVAAGQGGQYYSEVTSGENLYYSDTLTLEVMALPAISIQPPTGSFCPGDLLTLTTSLHGTTLPEGMTFRWQGADIEGDVTAESVQVILSPAHPEYKLEVVQDGCPVRDSVTVVVGSVQDVKIDAPAQLTRCQGEQIVLQTNIHGSPVGGMTFAWTGEGIVGAANEESVKITLDVNPKFVLEVTQNGCTLKDSVVFTIDEAWNLSIVEPPTGKTFCSGDELVLHTSLHEAIPAGAAFEWSGAGIIGDSKQESIRLKLTDNGLFTLIGSYKSCTATASIQLEVQKYDLKIRQPEDLHVCYQDEITLSTSLHDAVPEGAVFNWSGEGIIEGEHSETVKVKPGSNGKFKLISSSGVCQIQDSVIFIIQPAYEMKIKSPDAGVEVCYGDQVVLGLGMPAPEGATFEWSGKEIVGDRTGVTATVRVSDEPKYKLTSEYGYCTAVDSLVLKVQETHAVRIMQPETGLDACAGSELELGTTLTQIPEGMTFQWSGAAISGESTKEKVALKLADDGHITLRAHYGVCDMTDQIMFRIQPAYDIHIKTPAEGIDICYGETVNLGTTLTPVPAEMTFKWQGEGIEGDDTKEKVAVRLADNGKFKLHTEYKACQADDSIGFNIKKYDGVRIIQREVSVLDTSQDIRIMAVRLEGAALKWYLNDQLLSRFNNLETITFKVKEDSRIRVEQVMDGCVSEDFCNVTVRKVGVQKYKGRYGDGYTESRPGLQLIYNDLTVCQGMAAVVRLNNIYSGYNYEWFKWDKENGRDILLGSLNYLEILKCEPEDAGYYFCRVKDIDTEGTPYLYSDTLHLTVTAAPVAEIIPPDRKIVCYGEEVVLRTTAVSQDCRYEWTGPGLNVENGQPLETFQVYRSGFYGVALVTDACRTHDSLWIEVKKPLALSIPGNVHLAEPGEVTLDAYRENAAMPVIWTFEGNSETSVDPVTFLITKESIIFAKITENECEFTDSCHVYMKNAVTFHAVVESGDDGFAESGLGDLHVKEKWLSICNGGEVIFALREEEMPNCRYEWYKENETVPAFVGYDYLLLNSTPAMAGNYYCRAVRGDEIWNSDTLKLEIIPGPVAQIVADRDTVESCLGGKLSLQVNPEGYTYFWQGENIDDPTLAVIEASPAHNGYYVVEVSDGLTPCKSRDSIYVRLRHPDIRITGRQFLAEPGGVRMTALRTLVDVPVTWEVWTNGLEYTETTLGEVTLPVSGNGYVVAALTDQGCVARDTCKVFVKNAYTFKGNEEDGFALSRPLLRLKDKMLTPCASMDVRMELVGGELGNGVGEWYWIKEDQTTVKVAQGAMYQLLKSDPSFNGRYYCRMFYLPDGSYLYSDTLTLQVKNSVIAEITEPAHGLVYCYGAEPLVMKVAPEGNYTYRWTGIGILSDANVASIRVKPEQTTRYEVSVSDGECTSTDTITIQVNRTKVEIQSHLALSHPQKYHFQVYNPGGAALYWQLIENGVAGGWQQADSLVIAQDCRVVVRAGEGDCSEYDTCHVYVRTSKAWLGAEEDGFAVSRPFLRVKEKMLQICETEDVTMELAYVEQGMWTYQWYKVAQPQDVPMEAKEKNTILRSRTTDAGWYYCVAKNAASEEIRSDSMELRVQPGMDAHITGPADQAYCFGGEPLRLSVTPLGDYTYSWNGPGILTGANTAAILARPERTGKYTVIIDNGLCQSQDTMTIRVTRNEVAIMPQLTLNKPQRYHIPVYNPGHMSLEWQMIVDGEVRVLGNVDSLDLNKECVVVVKAGSGDCGGTDTCYVFVRQPLQYQGSVDDGFAASMNSLRVKYKELTPCPTEDVRLELVYNDYGYQGYEWFKVADGGDVAVGTGSSLEILKCTSAHTGTYYCRVPDMANGGYLYSDTTILTVRDGVIAQIDRNVATSYCYGSGNLTLRAAPQGNYTYVWTGGGIIHGQGTPEVIVRPELTTLYRVAITDAGGCTSQDTLMIHVNRTDVEIIPQLTLAYPQRYGFQVYNPARSVLHWQTITHGVASVWISADSLDLREDCMVVVKAGEGDCVGYDTCRVYVKNFPVCHGEEEDGFAESRPGLQLVRESAEVCQSNDVKLEVKDFGYAGYSYSWYKRNTDGSTTFVGNGRVYTLRGLRLEDAGFYYCEATVIGEVVTSADFGLTVKYGPVISIADNGNTHCYGTGPVVLDASATDNSSHSGKGFTYSWQGEGIVAGGNTAMVTVRPEKDTWYILTVRDNDTRCTAKDSVFFQTNRFIVEIPPVITLPQEKKDYLFKVYNPSGAALEWFIDGQKAVLAANGGLNIAHDCQVLVKGVVGDCEEYDTCQVYVRGNVYYHITENKGDEDGFAVSAFRPFVAVSPNEQDVCTGNTFRIEANVSAPGVYLYQWMKVNPRGEDTGPYSDKAVLELPDMNENMAGQYYCIVVDVLNNDPLSNVMISDTAMVNYQKGPKAKIQGGTDGELICSGSEVTLSAVVENDPTGRYRYNWKGEDILDPVTNKTVRVKPRFSGEYQVTVTDMAGQCSNTAVIRLELSNPEIHIQQQFHLAEAGEVVIVPQKAPGGKVNWYLNNTGNKVLTDQEVFRMNIKSDTKVIAELDQEQCSGYDTSWIYVKSPYSFKGGEDDGFAGVISVAVFRQMPGETEFCRGSELVRSVSGVGPGRLLKYEWRKLGSPTVVSTQQTLVIAPCELRDSGSYYCLAVDVTSSEQTKFFSDTVKVKVLPGPVAKISVPVDGKEVCYGTPFELSAKDTEIGKYPATDKYTYTWTGEGVANPRAYETTAVPMLDGTYYLEVTNGVCTSHDTVKVRINTPEVDIQRTFYVAERGNFFFEIENPDKNRVNWYLDNKQMATGQDSVTLFLYQNSQLVVEMIQPMEEGVCSRKDTCLVFFKDPRPFIAPTNSGDDGFYVSGTSFYIKSVGSTDLVCVGATAVFTIEVVGNDFYKYAWKKEGSSQVLSTEVNLRIPACRLEDAGSYYCEVTDGSSGKTLTSQKVPLQVVAVPRPHILTSSAAICENTPITLKVDDQLLDVDRNYIFLWSGPDLADRTAKSVTVTPKQQKTTYVLTVSDANCFAKDTIELKVKQATLKVPQLITIHEGEDISIQAETEAGASVNWTADGLLYTNRNPLNLTGLNKNIEFVAKTSGACPEQAAGRVQVRTLAGYAGGEDDGFTMPNELPQIIDQSESPIGCGQDSAVLWVKVLKKDKVKNPGGYVWEKYDENLKTYFTVNAAPNIVGLDSCELYFRPILPENEGRYRCRVVGDNGVAKSSDMYLIRGDVPVMKTRMKDFELCEKSPLVLQSDAFVPRNGKDPSYRWYFSGAGDNFKQLLPEVTLNKSYYELGSLTEAQEGYYMAEAYNLCGSAYDTVHVEVWQKPWVARQSKDTVVCLYGSVRLWVEPAGGGDQWRYQLYQVEADAKGNYKKDIRKVYDNLNAFFDIGMADDSYNGYFRWIVANNCDTVAGKLFKLTIEHSPVVQYRFTDTTICLGTTPVILNAATNVVAPGASTKYYWTKNDIRQTQTANSYRIPSLAYADTGVYKCYAYNACPAQEIRKFALHKKETPVILEDPQIIAGSYCEENPVNIVIKYTSDAGPGVINWYHGNSKMTDQGTRVTGTQKDTLKISKMLAADEGKYKVYITNGCPGTTVSDEVNLHVKLPARYAASGDLTGKDLYLCASTTGTFQVVATGEAPITYTWLKENTVLAGEKGSSLTIRNVTTASEGIYRCFVQNECSVEKGEGTQAELHMISPVNYSVNVERNGKYCGYEEGCLVRMQNFEQNVTYRLYRRRSDGGADLVKSVSGTSVPTGEALSFGVWTQGTYYIYGVATEGGRTCQTKMGDDFQIIRDVTPNQYELYVSNPLCTGELAGNLSLRSSDNDTKMEYVLQRMVGDDEWMGYNKTLTGTGDALNWNNCPAGTYRVMARHLTSGCYAQIGQNIDMTERPMPQVFTLLPVNGDTTNCAGMADDVRLKLSGSASDCSYRLVKDRQVTSISSTDTPPTWGPLAGTGAGTVYRVLATTNYGCVDTIGYQVVVQKAAPRTLAITPDHGGYYCTADTLPAQVKIAAPTQTGVRYDVYAVGGSKLTDVVLFGNERGLSFGVPLREATYYVQAVDTLDGCKAEMSNRFTIREDKLKVVADPLTQTITAGLTAQLGAVITNNVGTTRVAWAPAAKVSDPNILNPVTIALNRPERYVITVSDKWCTTQAYADVLTTGDSLAVAIKQFDCFTDKDTMWVCENAPLTLCGWANGGKGGYSYQWWINQDGTDVVIGDGAKLYDYVMKEKGYIYLEVFTEKGQRARDSIWVDINRVPGGALFSVNGCVALSETATFELKYPEREVHYSLEFAPNNANYKTTGEAQTGDGSALFTYPVVFNEMTDGYYRMKAEKNYESGNTCVSYIDTLELREKPTAFAVRGIGENLYCAGTKKDTICLASSQADVIYALINTSVPEVVESLPGKRDSLLFSGYFGAGRYRVVAQKGSCRDSMSGVVNIYARPRPIVQPSWTGDYCWTKGLEGQEIGLSSTLGGTGALAVPYQYTLYLENEGVVNRVAAVTGNGLPQSFGKQTKVGNYFIVSEDKYHCTDTARNMQIIKSPAPVNPQNIVGTYNYTEPGWTTTLEIYNTEYPLEYVLVNDREEPVAEFGGWDGNKLYCSCTLSEGIYYVKALSGGCSAHVTTVRVYKCTLKAVIAPVDPILAGTPVSLTVRVEGNQGMVNYDWQPEKMINGDHTFSQITTVQLKKGQRFIVSVEDSRCSVQTSVDVRVEGEGLSGDIVLADGVTPVDTLKLCEGSGVNLSSWTSGGSGEISYEWRDKNGVIGRGLDKLSDFAMAADGFIALHVSTPAGQTAEDTVWVVFRKNPRKDITLEKENLNCVLSQEAVHLMVKAAESGVKYGLEYSGNGSVYTPWGEVQTGAGADLNFSWQLSDGAGYYRLRAAREYTDGVTCPVYFDPVEVRERPMKFDVRSIGKTDYCEGTRKDTICVDSSQYGVTYQLMRLGSPDPVKLATISGSDDSLLYTGVYGTGNYQVVALRGVCQETMNGTVTITARKNPVIDVKDLYESGDHCWAKGDPGLWTGLKTTTVNPEATPYYYKLIREFEGVRETIDSKSVSAAGSIDWGRKTAPGTYTIVVSDKYLCKDSVDDMRLILAPEDVVLAQKEGMFCYGDEGWETTLKIYDINPMIDYVLTTTAGVEIGHFGELSAERDTLYYTGVLPAGVLAVKAIAGDCKRNVAQVTVKERAKLVDKPLIAPLTACEGQEELTMGVQSSEPDIMYELYEKIDGGIDWDISRGGVKGDGGQVVLGKRNTKGIYYVVARDSVLGCTQRMSGEYVIRALPEYFDITVQNAEYCEGERGAVIGISGTQRGVNYTLQKKDEVTAIYANVIPTAKIIGLGSTEESVFSGYYGTGTYRIVADVCGYEPMRGEINVEEIPLPKDIAVGIEGSACVDSTMNISLKQTEVGVKYVLYHEGADLGQDTIRGNGADQRWTLAAQSGTYSIRAIRRFCNRTLSQQITIGMPIRMGNLTGIERMCINEAKTLYLDQAQPAITYKLWGSLRDTLIPGVNDVSQVTFADVPAGDTYYVLAYMNMCETRSRAYVFEGMELPVFSPDDFVVSDCEAAINGAGQITLQHMNPAYSYLLTGPTANVVADLLRPQKDTVFTGMQAGEYNLLVTDRSSEAGCSMDKIYKTVRKPVPADSLVQPLMYCDGEEGLMLKLSGSTYQVVYQLLNENGGELETVNYPMKGFIYPHQAGKYIFRKEVIGLNGGCSTAKQIEIKKLLQPNPDFDVIAEGGSKGMCETGENRITIQGSEKDVKYILRRSDGFNADTVIGVDDIGPIVFAGRKPAGEYRIYAYNAAGCESIFSGTFKVNPVPSAITAKGCSYCYSSQNPDAGRGCEINVSGLTPYAAYYLVGEQGRMDTITLRNAGTFKRVPDGLYTVVGEYQATGCRDTVARTSILGIATPKVFPIRNSLTSSNCATFAVVTLDQTEGDSVLYTLYMNDDFVMETLHGTGGRLNFSGVGVDGYFRVKAQKVGAACSEWMEGKVVITSKKQTPVFVSAGQYCQDDTTSTIQLTLKNGVKGWKYYVASGNRYSDTVQVVGDPVITWKKVGRTIIKAGDYALWGINECNEPQLLTELTVKAMPLPALQHLKDDGVTLCSQFTHEFVLAQSEKKVSYHMEFATGTEVLDFSALAVPGTGDTLAIKAVVKEDINGPATYYIVGTVDSTGCRRVVDIAHLNVSYTPDIPSIAGDDRCIEPGSAGSITIKLGERVQPAIDYWLVVNDSVVGFIDRDDAVEDMEFKTQAILGCYYVIGDNGFCQNKKQGPCLGEKPDLKIPIRNAGNVQLCAGEDMPVVLEYSQVGCRYVLVYNGNVGRDTLIGTGQTLEVGRITKAGNYQVYAMVSEECNGVLEDIIMVEVMRRPELHVVKEASYCDGGVGANFKVLNSIEGIQYYLLKAHSTTGQLTTRAAGPVIGSGQDFVFKGNDGKDFMGTAGLYRVEAKDLHASACAVSYDTITVNAVPALKRFKLEVLESPYICDGAEEKTLALESSEKNVQYGLYLARTNQMVSRLVDGTGAPLRFTVTDTGTYYVMGIATKGDACEARMANSVTILTPPALTVYNLVGDTTNYCETLDRAPGRLHLPGSDGTEVMYQLYRDGVAVGNPKPGQNGGYLTWSQLEGKPCNNAQGDADGYNYTVVATNTTTGCARPMNGRVNIIKESMVVLEKQDTNLDVCMGSQNRIMVTANGCGLHYEWRKDGEVVGQDRVYEIDSITEEHIGIYTCDVSNSCSRTSIVPVRVKVRAVVIQDKKMEDVLVCPEGGKINVTLATEARAERYEWRKLDGSDAVLSQSAVLSLRNVGKEAEGLYECIASTTCGALKDTCLLEFDRAAKIEYAAPGQAIRCVGSEYHIKLESRDSVKWFLNGNELGHLGNEYTIDGVKLTDAGDYAVQAWNKCSSTGMKNLQNLFVDDTIKVVSVTDSIAHFCNGSVVTLQITTTPSRGVEYSWFKNGRPETNATNKYNVGKVTDANDKTSYWVYYKNSCNEGMKSIMLRVDNGLNYKKLGAKTLACMGQGEVKLAVKAADAEGETYQWYYKKTTTADPLNLAGKASRLSVVSDTSSNGYYFCQISNACQTMYSDTTLLRVDTVPVITGNLRDTVICENGNFVYGIRAAGGGLTYQWQMKRRNSSEVITPEVFSNDKFYSSSVMELKNVSVLEDSCLIWCKVTNGCGVVYSDTAVVRVTHNATVVLERSSVRLCPGQELQMVAHLQNSIPGVKYVYYYSVNGVMAPEVTFKGVTDTVRFANAAAGTYRVERLEANGGCYEGNPKATMTVTHQTPFTATISGSGKACFGKELQLKVDVRGSDSQAWVMELRRKSDGAIATEFGSSPVTIDKEHMSLSIPVIKTESYYISSIYEANNPFGCAGQVAGTVKFEPLYPVSVHFTPTDTVFGGCAEIDLNRVLSPQLTPQNDPLYDGRFYVNGKEIQSTILDQKPGVYRVVYKTVTNNSCVDSAVVRLTRDSLPSITVVQGDTNICPGATAQVIYHINGKVPQGGRTPRFKMIYTGSVIDKNGRETYPDGLLSNRTADEHNNVTFEVFNNGEDRARIYRVRSVADRYGCDLSSDALTTTVNLRRTPVLEVGTLSEYINDGQETKTQNYFLLPKGALVNFVLRTNPESISPWKVSLERDDTVRKTIEFSSSATFSANGEGTYRFIASDKYCPVSDFNLKETKREVAYSELGFLKVKMYLEGAMDKNSGKMKAAISDLLPRRNGLTQWPQLEEGMKLVDWVVLELRKHVDSVAVVRDTVLVRNDGMLIDPETGSDMLSVVGNQFSDLQQNTYYVVIKHRNHLTMASRQIRVYPDQSNAQFVDLTNYRNIYTFDGNLLNHVSNVALDGGVTVWCMSVGNVLSNALISAANPGEIQKASQKQTTQRGYYLLDVNFDGVVKWTSDGILKKQSEDDDAYMVYKNRHKFSEVPE